MITELGKLRKDEIWCSMAVFLCFGVCRVYASMDFAAYKHLQVFMDSQIEGETQLHILQRTRFYSALYCCLCLSSNIILYFLDYVYFDAGVNLLLFSYPPMLVAAMGCVYLHLKKTKSDSKRWSFVILISSFIHL